jgi:predicted CopG family antitoxin
MSTQKRHTVTLSENTYNQLVKCGDLSSSFDSTISSLIKSAKKDGSK